MTTTPCKNSTVVISGMGIVSPIGCDLSSFTQNFRDGLSGITQQPLRNGTMPNHPIGMANHFEENLKEIYDFRKLRRWDPSSQMTLLATLSALADAKIMEVQSQNWQIDPQNLALILGHGLGGLGTVEKFFQKVVEVSPQSANPSLFPETVPNAATGHLSIELGLNVPSTTIAQKQITFEAALNFALHTFQMEDVDWIITGCVEDLNDWEILAHEKSGYLAHSSPASLKPFDRQRSGTLLGEGGAIFILERQESAEKRGHKPYARIIGCQQGGHPTRPGSWPQKRSDSHQQSQIFQSFFKENGLQESQIDWVLACALGSPTLDLFEANVLHELFGSQTPITSVCGQWGTFTSMGSLRLAAALVALNQSWIPKTVGLDDPEFSSLNYVCQPKSLDEGTHRVFIHSMGDGGSYSGYIIESLN